MDPPEKMDCRANGEVILGVQGPSQPHLRENLLPAINMNPRSIITAFRDHRLAFAKFESLPPGMVRRGNRRPSSLSHRCFLGWERPACDLFKSQDPIPIHHLQRAIEIFMDLHLRGPDPILDLVELSLMGDRPVIPKPPFGLNA